MRTRTKTTLVAAAAAAVLSLAGAPAASASYEFLNTWGADSPQDVATSADGSRVYVLNGFGTPPDDSRGITEYDANGHQLAQWRNPTNGSHRFLQPHSLERGANGKLYELDGSDVNVIDPDTGAELQSFDVNGSFPVPPTDLATAPDGSFYVFHQGYHNGDNHPDNRPPQVIHFSANGTELQRWGESGDADGQFHQGSAQAIAVAPDGTVLVGDSWQKRIQRFTPDGHFKDAWSDLGSCGAGTGSDLMSMWDIAADPAGGAYLTSFDSRIVHFAANGKADEVFGVRGANPGQFTFPGTLDVDSAGGLAVNDEYNDRIQRFRHVPGSANCAGGGSTPAPAPGGGETPSSGGGGASSGPAPQFGVIGTGDITAPSVGLTAYHDGGIADLAFEATCSEQCTVTARPRASITAGRRTREVDLQPVTVNVPAGTQQHVALKPSDELVAAMYQAITTRGGDASVRVSLDAVDGAGNVGHGSVSIDLGFA
jgi:sugar lactone lactonase YvrE